MIAVTGTVQGKLLAVLEGGHQPSALARCVADAIAVLDNAGEYRQEPAS